MKRLRPEPFEEVRAAIYEQEYIRSIVYPNFERQDFTHALALVLLPKPSSLACTPRNPNQATLVSITHQSTHRCTLRLLLGGIKTVISHH